MKENVKPNVAPSSSSLRQAAACKAACCQYQSACKGWQSMVIWDGLGVGELESGWGAMHEWKDEVAIRLWILRNLLLGFGFVGFTVQK